MRRRPLLVERQEQAVQPDPEPDAGRGSAAEQLDEPVVATSTPERLLLALPSLDIELEGGPRVVVEPADETGLDAVGHTEYVEVFADRGEMRSARLAQAIRDARRPGIDGRHGRVLGIRQAEHVPLEAEPTAALAAALAESRFWKQEVGTFLGNALGVRGPGGLVGLRPYKPGRIPAVFVHGTASSPARWADMVNDLIADARLRTRFEFWFFSYDSGNPIAYSGMQLREGLAQAVARADPAGARWVRQCRTALRAEVGERRAEVLAGNAGTEPIVVALAQ